ncbi:carbohydrate kinase family protein [Lonepinella koalarum]|uniref:carbohydrate kinase family protein n=1 Tax=Lonepinella koalarum TaxID=53417 RepID=UPI003F6DD3B2
MADRNGILAIGNLLVDHAMQIAEYPTESMLTTISKVERHCGGCTNLVFDLATLDEKLPLTLSGAIGKDADGELILTQAKAHNVNTDAVYWVDLPTSFTDVMINSKTGDRTFFHYIGAMENYSPEHVLPINCGAKIVHFAYLPLMPALLNDQLTALLQELSQQGFLISIDLVSVNDKTIFAQYIRPNLPYIDFVIINDVEAQILTERENEEINPATLQQMAKDIIQFGVKNTVIIHCPKWAVACNAKNESIIVPSFMVDKKDIVSTLGAGDAFCAGCLYGLHQDMSLADTLKLGHSLAYFNLFSISATDGAVSFGVAKNWIVKMYNKI